MSRSRDINLESNWSRVSNFVRMILFAYIILLLPIALIQRMLLLWISPQTLSIHLFINVISVSLLLIALLGAHGAFYQHKKSLHLFSIASATHATFAVLFVVYTFSGGINRKFDENSVHILDLQQSRHILLGDYNNLIWDNIQRGAECADVEWDQFRPADVSRGLYPKSCCIFNTDTAEQTSNSSSIVQLPMMNGLRVGNKTPFKIGCSARLRQLEKNAQLLTCLMFVIQLLFAFLASCIANNRSNEVHRNNPGSDGEDSAGTCLPNSQSLEVAGEDTAVSEHEC